MSEYIPGDYNVICDVTGFKCKRSECRKTWDGKLVRADQWDEKHPQLTLKPRVDRQSVSDPRPRQPVIWKTDVKPSDL